MGSRRERESISRARNITAARFVACPRDDYATLAGKARRRDSSYVTKRWGETCHTSHRSAINIAALRLWTKRGGVAWSFRLERFTQKDLNGLRSRLQLCPDREIPAPPGGFFAGFAVGCLTVWRGSNLGPALWTGGSSNGPGYQRERVESLTHESNAEQRRVPRPWQAGIWASRPAKARPLG